MSSRRRIAVIAVAVGALTAAGLTAVVTSASAATCSDVEVVFARGTGEIRGLGMVGSPFASTVKSKLSGLSVTTYAVDYAANVSQTSAGPGATDMSKHITSTASQCPNTSFVIGGYSQGASVTDIAIGIRTALGSGEAIPESLAPQIKAVVVFGNPLRMLGTDITKASKLYGSKALDICNAGDPVCGAGVSMLAHLRYATNGSTTEGAEFAASKVKAG
ncbi:MAG: cutinase family protein [Micromonosporaceae bacterium]|nr:cutinase family protein [Micromonosporaceae bacterium]